MAKTIKNVAEKWETLGLTPTLEDPLEETMASSLQYSWLGNFMDKSSLQATLGGCKDWTPLNDYHFYHTNISFSKQLL